MKKLQTEDMAKAIDREIRYTRKREQLYIDQLRAADAAFNDKLAALYRSTGRDITDEILSQYLRYCAGSAMDIHQAYQKADKMDVFAFAEKAKEYVESRDFSTKANEELKLYNLKMRTSRLELMKRQIELDGLKLYDKEDAMLRKRLQKEAMDEVERQAGILSLSETTRKSLIRGAGEIINGDFHGAPFSSRIWANKNELVARLQVGLERSILQGEHPDRWAHLFTDLVSAEMGEKAGRALFAARRLAITESARVMSEIQFRSFEKGGYKKYIWITEIDDRTCPVCSALDGEVFDIDRSEIGANLPPLHPFCRCSVAAYVEDLDDKRYNDIEDPLNGFNMEMDKGKQRNHIFGTHEFKQREKNGNVPSFFRNSEEEILKIFNLISRTGDIVQDPSNPKGRKEKTILPDSLDGTVVNNIDGKRAKTDRVVIKYDKDKGWHMYPDYPSKKGGKT